MDLQLNGKVVLVAGGSQGMGRACAEAFAKEGCKVAIVSRSRDNLKQAEEKLSARGVTVLSIAADLAKPEEAERAAAETEKKLGPIDILINAAGSAKHNVLEEMTAEAWRQGMDSKYFTYINMMQAVLPAMRKRGKGAVVNLIGIGGKVPGIDHLAGGAANAALMLATTGLAKGYAPYGVRVNGINPGGTVTERKLARMEPLSKQSGKSIEEMLKEGAAKIPLRRFAMPEDIAQAALFLASERACYITGAIIPMEGGSRSMP